MNINIGPREADLLMDALLALGYQWEGTQPGETYAPKPGDEDRPGPTTFYFLFFLLILSSESCEQARKAAA
jgi:hypothetical protein